LEPFAEFLESVKRADFTDVLNFLRSNPEILENFNITFIIFLKEDLQFIITEANILSENAFFPELKKRILNKVLPP
jgi:site-specific recombinase